jgi:hypothetical protein
MVFGFKPFQARCTLALRQALCAPCSVLNQGSPVPLAKFHMTPILSFLISSGSKKKEPRYVCLSEAKSSHSHKMWTEVSSSVPHFLQVGLLLSPIIYKCLLRVLCPLSRPITTLDCVLLKDNNRPLVAGSGPEISSRACLWSSSDQKAVDVCRTRNQLEMRPFVINNKLYYHFMITL